MKTELDWVSFKDCFPQEGRKIFVLGIVNGVHKEICVGFSFNGGIKGLNCVVFHSQGNEFYFYEDNTIFFNGKEMPSIQLTHWAYVNLPEENEVKEQKKRMSNFGLGEIDEN